MVVHTYIFYRFVNCDTKYLPNIKYQICFTKVKADTYADSDEYLLPIVLFKLMYLWHLKDMSIRLMKKYVLFLESSDGNYYRCITWLWDVSNIEKWIENKPCTHALLNLCVWTMYRYPSFFRHEHYINEKNMSGFFIILGNYHR